MANNFALRHHNDHQKDNYDDSFLTWLFYLYLSTVHLMLARIAGSSRDTPVRPIRRPGTARARPRGSRVGCPRKGQVQMDLAVGVSACPAGLGNGGRVQPLTYEILEP